MQNTPDLPELFREISERLTEISDALDARYAETEAADREHDAQFAARARKGELGPDWQRVQNRIDIGETTLAAVFSGEDDSPAARALRGQAQTNLRELSERLREEDEQSEAESPGPTRVVSQAAAESRDHANAAAQRIAETLASIHPDLLANNTPGAPHA